jgi:type II secretory ATPase GspE/PulE/Tfp pilus assembly ATPase PilB-like protein
VEREQLGFDASVLYRAQGCAQCTKGYRGRVGIFELLMMTPEVAVAVTEQQGDGIRAAAAAAGTGTLWQDGLHKAEAGLTTVSELRRVL